MVTFVPRLVGRFTHPQDISYIVPACTIGLSLRGCEGYLWGDRWISSPGPFLAIKAEGQRSVGRYGAGRDNWAILGDVPAVRPGPTPQTITIGTDAGPVVVPSYVPLEPAQVAPLHALLLRLHDAFENPVPVHRLTLALGFAALLDVFVAHAAPPPSGPVARLKRLIDADASCQHTLTTLSRRCGLHPDHLRERFVASYGLTPIAYRTRCRVAQAMALIHGSDLPAHAIGQRLGFPHATHFSAFLRRATGMTPRAAIRRYRLGEGALRR